ncbi:MAG: ParA family protein [Planctomycetes bacterium]|nr:ParA family protein [Planctomycetota bacterium]
MRKIAVLNQKGGVGKTTTVANVAAALAIKGQRVIAVDLDPQSHLTIHLGVDPDSFENGAYEVLTKSASIADSLVNVRENLWVLGANIDLVGAESELVSEVGRETIFHEAVETISDDYDYLIIDCPPSLGLLSLNALAAVDEVVIPLQPHFLALQGLGQLLQTVTLVSKRINPSLKISAILLCMFDSRATLSSEVKADIQNFIGNSRGTNCPWADADLIPIHVRRNVKLAEAPSYGKTIFEYEPDCNGSRDYAAIADFLHDPASFKKNDETVEIEEHVKEPAEEIMDDAVIETITEEDITTPLTELVIETEEETQQKIVTEENTQSTETSEQPKYQIKEVSPTEIIAPRAEEAKEDSH